MTNNNNNLFKKIATSIIGMAMAIGVGVGINSFGGAKESRAEDTTYEQLTSIANIDEEADYVLGIDGTGFHYEGTSSWGKTALPSAHTPLYYTLKKASDGNSFTAETTISSTKYYLQIPTSNTFSMATSTGTNTDIIIGTTQVSGTNYAVANKTTTTRHLRINGTSGLRSYAGTTGTMAFFYKVVSGGSTEENTSVTLSVGKDTLTSVGEYTTVTAVVKDSSAAVIAGASVSFEVSPSGIVELSGSEELTRTVTAVSYGTATITATYAGIEGTYKSSTNTINVVVDVPETFPEGTSGDATFTKSATVVVASVNFDAIKLGKSGGGGSDTVTIPANSVAMTFRAACWNGKSSVLTVSGVENISPSGADSYTPASDTGIASNSPFTLAGSKKAYLHTIYFDKTTTDTDVTFASATERIVIWDIKYYLTDTFTVSFNLQGHGSAISSQTVSSGEKATEPTAPSAEGYVFGGWFKEAGCTNQWNFASDTVSANTILYAKWTEIPTFTVSFNLQGHGSAIDSQTINSGEKATEPTAPTASGYVFGGWFKEAGCTNQWNFASDTVSANTILYAKWTQVTTYTVSFDLQGHGSAIDSQTINSGEKAAEPTAPTASGYVFGGWFKEDGCTNQWNFSTDTVTANTILYAKWTEKSEYNVSFDFSKIDFTGWTNSYSGQNHTVEYAQGDVEFNDCALPNSDQAIHDIPVSKGGTVVFVAVEGITISEATFTLRQWGAKTKTAELHYSTDGGETYTSTDITSSTFTISDNNLPSSTNAIKLTFSEASNQVGIESLSIVYTGGAAPVTTYTLTYDANGGTGTMTDSHSPYNSGATVTVLENTFTRDGYTFAHWSTATDGSGTDYEEGATFNISANTTLYAIWEKNSGGCNSSAKRCYRLVTSTDDLVAGAKYLIVATESSYAMSTTQNTNNRGQEEISISDTIVSSTKDSVQEVVLGGSTGAWNFGVSGGYLYAASSSANHLKTEASPDANGNANWAISFDGNVATIVAQGNYSRNTIQYNSGSGLFACYSSASQTNVSLYRLDFETTLLENITCTGSGSHSMPDGYTWNTDLQGVYNDLPDSEKSNLAEKSATPGSGLERYDYIIGKYNPTGKTEGTDYLNFIGRTIVPLSNPRIILDNVLGSNNNPTVIIVVVSMLSITALGAFFFIKKKKEN